VHIKIAYPYPILILEGEKRYLVVSDLHIGFEASLKGVRLDNSYMHDMLRDILHVLKEDRCDAIVLLGDIKDRIDRIGREERISIPYFFNELLNHLSIDNIHLVKGNHDAGIDRLLPYDLRNSVRSTIIIDDTLLTHGHIMPRSSMKIKRIIIGHLHPVLLNGSIMHGERVWVIMKATVDNNDDLEVIIMPSMNRYLSADRDRSKNGIPLLRRIKSVTKAIIVTLNGAIVGDENTLEYVLNS
jgi:uncharacterized protein